MIWLNLGVYWKDWQPPYIFYSLLLFSFWNVGDIQEGDDIIIKPADKGSAVVVMDKTTYLQEAERQLLEGFQRTVEGENQ
jgi:hypothetical protein